LHLRVNVPSLLHRRYRGFAHEVIFVWDPSPEAGFLQPDATTTVPGRSSQIATRKNCLNETPDILREGHLLCKTFFKKNDSRWVSLRYYWGMSKAVKALIIIVLAVAVAGGAALYFSRQPDEPGNAAENSPSTPLQSTGGGHLRGPESAKVTLVEFGDYQCPSCKAFHPLVQELLSRYPQQVRLEFHHYPLVSIHGNAMAASLAVEAAGEQGKYWEMHDLIFETQEQWSKNPNPEPDFLALAGRLGLNQNQFMQSMRSPQLQDRVLQDVVRAREANVEAVPTFFIDGQKQNIPLSISAFVDLVEARLQDKGTSNTKPAE
jgi:protein-disulfide isomerase